MLRLLSWPNRPSVSSAHFRFIDAKRARARTRERARVHHVARVCRDSRARSRACARRRRRHIIKVPQLRIACAAAMDQIMPPLVGDDDAPDDAAAATDDDDAFACNKYASCQLS